MAQRVLFSTLDIQFCLQRVNFHRAQNSCVSVSGRKEPVISRNDGTVCPNIQLNFSLFKTANFNVIASYFSLCI